MSKLLNPLACRSSYKPFVSSLARSGLASFLLPWNHNYNSGCLKIWGAPLHCQYALAQLWNTRQSTFLSHRLWCLFLCYKQLSNYPVWPYFSIVAVLAGSRCVHVIQCVPTWICIYSPRNTSNCRCISNCLHRIGFLYFFDIYIYI